MVKKTRSHLVSCYDHILIVSIYMLLPIGFFGYAWLLGLGVSFIYCLYSWCTLVENAIKTREVIMDLCFYLVLNFLMMAFQAGMEHSLRQKVLSRRQLLQQNLLLKVGIISVLLAVLSLIL